MDKKLISPIKPMFDKKTLVKLILPIMAEQILAALIGMADTLMVSNCGEQVVSGVALVDSISLLLVAVFTALSTGGAIVVSQYIGRGERENAKHAADQVFIVTLVISLIIMTICLCFREFLLNTIFGEMEKKVFNSAMDYFLYISISYPFLAQFNTCSAIFRADNKAIIPMLISLGMNVMNVCGNALFIFVFDMEAGGAGLASMISRAVGFIVIYILMLIPSRRIGLSAFYKMRTDKATVGRILRVGLPTGFENGIFQIGKLLVQGFITSYGTMHIAANAISSNMSNIAIMVCASFGLAMTTVVGQCMGAGEIRQAKNYLVKLTGCGWVIITILAVAMILLRETITEWYNLSGGTATLAKLLILICSIESIVAWPLAFLPGYGMRAAGDVRFSMITAVSSMWIFRVGLGYILGSIVGWKSAGILLGMGADWVFRGIMFTYRFFSGRWLQKRVI